MSVAGFSIRPVRDEDSARILAILAECYAEYPGCLLEMSEVPELVQPATSFAKMRGAFWVAEENGVVVGFVALAPDHDDPELGELKKLYTARSARGRGLGRTLVELVLREAKARTMRRVHLWSDTRFETAHRVYERCGFVRLAGTRDLHDVSASHEWHYERRV
jgi:putative acetyltransferase